MEVLKEKQLEIREEANKDRIRLNDIEEQIQKLQIQKKELQDKIDNANLNIDKYQNLIRKNNRVVAKAPKEANNGSSLAAQS